jgi:serine/threonine protein kinase
MKRENSSELTERDSTFHQEIQDGALLQERYRIGGLLGEGGMGVTFKATDETTGQTVAIKFLNQERTTNPKDLRRFDREAKTARQLNHPGICRVLDFAVLDKARPYFVMEFVDGITLADRLKKEGQLGVEETFDLFIQICDALAYAHANGILHRDIKPGNIMVTNHESSVRAKLLDFGIAKSIVPGEAVSQSITETGELLGSPLYMSPEQARGDKLDARSDLYSLGCTLYESLTGGPPHLGQTPVATLLKRERDKPIALSEASMGGRFSEQLEQVVSHLLEINPDNRYHTAIQLKEDLILAREGRLPIAAAHQSQAPLVVPPQSAHSRPWFFYLLAFIASFLVVAIISGYYLQKAKQKPLAPAPIDYALSTASDDPKFAMLEVNDHLRKGDSLYLHDEVAPAAREYEAARAVIANNKLAGMSLERVIRGLAACYAKLQRFTEARPLCEATVALDVKEHGKKSEDYADSLTQLAGVYVQEAPSNDQGAWEKASPKFEEARSIYRTLYGPDSLRLADCMALQGIACSTKQPVHAQPLLEKALTVYRKGAETRKLVRTLEGLAFSYAAQKNRRRSELYWNEAIELLAHQPKEYDDELGQSIFSLCKVYTDDLRGTDEKQYRIARDLCLRYLPRFRGKPEHYAAPMLAQLGELDMRIGVNDGTWRIYQRQALPLFQEALSLMLKSPGASSASVPATYLRIGQIESAQGHLAEAMRAQQSALDAIEKHHINDATLEAGILLQLAALYTREGNLAEATLRSERGASLCESSPICNNTPMHASFLVYLAGHCERNKDWSQAETLCKRARSIFARIPGKTPPQIKMIDTMLANIHQYASK